MTNTEMNVHLRKMKIALNEQVEAKLQASAMSKHRNKLAMRRK